MPNKMEICFIYLCMFVYIGIELSNGEECPQSSGGCCSAYFRNSITRRCQECPPGSYGHNCSVVCNSGYYGKRCLLKCNCENERCDNIRGCVEDSAIITDQTVIHQMAKTKSTTDRHTNNHNVTGKTAGSTSDDGVNKIESLNENTTTRLILFITITIIAVVSIVVLLVFRKYYPKWLVTCRTKHRICFKYPFCHEDDLPETEEVAIRNVPDNSTFDGVDGLYYEIRESQMVNLRNLVGGKSDCPNDRRMSRSMNNLQKTSVYNHLNYTKSTPNISGYFNNIYDDFNDTHDSVYDTSRRKSVSNCLYGIIEI